MPVYALGDLVPHVDPEAFVHPDATVIGAVVIGPESTIWPQAVLRGDSSRIVVGDDCVVGHLAHLEGCTVEDRALIGNGSIVLHRAVIESNALVGAGAVVPNDMRVPAYAMALGVPARVREQAVGAGQIEAMAERYVAKGKWYREEQRRLA